MKAHSGKQTILYASSTSATGVGEQDRSTKIQAQLTLLSEQNLAGLNLALVAEARHS